MKRAVVAIVICISGRVFADTASDARQKFEADISAFVGKVENQFTGKPQQSEVVAVQRNDALSTQRVTSARAGARSQALDADNAVTLPRLASLAIKTDVKDTEAGVVIAPLALMGSTSDLATGFTLVLAALEDDQFRAGASLSIPIGRHDIDFDDLRVEACKFDKARYDSELRKRAWEFGSVCDALVPMTPDINNKAAAKQIWIRGLAACGVTNPPAGATITAQELGAAVNVIDTSKDLSARVTSLLKLVELVKGSSGTDPTKFDLLDPRIERLDKMRRAPTKSSCLTKDEDELAAAVTRAKWRQPLQTIGLSAHADFYPIQFGFNPDESERLAHGNAATIEERLEYRTSCRRHSLSLGFGAKTTRDTAHGDFATSVRPAVGFQYIVGRLDGGSLLDEQDDVNTLKKGELPPLFVVGVDGVFGVTVAGKPDSQESAIEEVGVTPFADFRINKDIAFRIGVPLKAELVTRKADAMAMPEVTEKKALQWTVPVFLTTVLEL
jgi:hypothetical protein